MAATKVTDELIEELQSTLKLCADPLGWNGPAFQMLAQEVVELGKPVTELTLVEVAGLVAKATKRYTRMCDRLDEMGVR